LWGTADGGVALGAPDGARSATGSAPSAAAEVKRWSAGRKKQAVLRLLRGESMDALSRELAVRRSTGWRTGSPLRVCLQVPGFRCPRPIAPPAFG